MTTREDVEVFKDQANIYTMIVGGLIISAIIYFITSTVFNSLKNTTWSYINYILPIVIMYLSIVKGLQPDVIIKIFKNSGKIHAKSRKYYWEGNILEVDIFQVLQREIELKDHILTEFKLYLLLHDETTYEVPITKAAEALRINTMISTMKTNAEMIEDKN